jgi:hypothetical protein
MLTTLNIIRPKSFSSVKFTLKRRVIRHFANRKDQPPSKVKSKTTKVHFLISSLSFTLRQHNLNHAGNT